MRRRVVELLGRSRDERLAALAVVIGLSGSPSCGSRGPSAAGTPGRCRRGPRRSRAAWRRSTSSTARTRGTIDPFPVVQHVPGPGGPRGGPLGRRPDAPARGSERRRHRGRGRRRVDRPAPHRAAGVAVGLPPRRAERPHARIRQHDVGRDARDGPRDPPRRRRAPPRPPRARRARRVRRRPDEGDGVRLRRCARAPRAAARAAPDRPPGAAPRRRRRSGSRRSRSRSAPG